MGGRLAVGLWTLAPSTEVRILAPQPNSTTVLPPFNLIDFIY